MVKVFRSTVIDVPIDELWHLLRDFNGHREWHPAVAESVIEDGRAADEVGCVRRFSLADGGGELREQLLALSDSDHSFTYCILDAPLPLTGYVASVQLRPVTDGTRTLWEWRSEFAPPPEEAVELSRLVAEDIYGAGFEAVRQRYGGGPGPSSRRHTSVGQAAGVPGTAAIAGHGLILEAYGGPETLSWRDTEAPPPGAGEARIRHTAIGLNFIDVYCRTGYFDFVSPPGILGMEAAGVVVDVGPGVHGLMPGDRIAYACPPPGAYCEVRTMAADFLVLLPDEIDDEIAAAVLLKGMTAEFLLHRVHQVKEGDTVLVHAAAGGVGLLLCQWARHLGATVIGTVGSEEKAHVARRHGCAFPIVYRDEDFVATTMEITGGRGCDVVYDAVGRETFARSYDALAVRGHLVSYGQASGPIDPIDIAAYADKSATVSRPNYGHYAGTSEDVRRMSDRLFQRLIDGTLSVDIGQRFPLREAAEAHRRLEKRSTIGSTVLVP
jgi:NADPH2:quinone reductase